MTTHFPKTGDDGSFEIRVRFGGAPKAGLPAVRCWVDAWVKEHSEWEAVGETHRFFDYFLETPRAELGPHGELQIFLRGANGAKRFWKNRYVRLVSRLRAEFPDVGALVAVEDERQNAMVDLGDNINVWNTCLIILREQGYVLSLQSDDPDADLSQCFWVAEKDGFDLWASDPIQLLGLAAIHQYRSPLLSPAPNWWRVEGADILDELITAKWGDD